MMISGMDATFEGYGLTPDGKDRETAKKEPVTVIANDLCGDILKSNNSRHLINKAKLKSALKEGVTDDLLCTMGKYVEDTDTYTVSTEGDKIMSKIQHMHVLKFTGPLQRRQRRPTVH